MTAMLHRLVEEISAEMQLHLPQEWLPANEDHSEIIQRLSQSGLLDRDGLMALLLRRADEERIASTYQARPGHRTSSLIQPLVSHEDAEVAAAAMAVLIARGRRRDRYGQALIELDDIPFEDVSVLVQAIAAALTDRKPVHVSSSVAERELCNAAKTMLGRYDPMRSLDQAIAELVRLLDDRQLLDDAWIRLTMESAEIPVLEHIIARRAAIHPAVAASDLLSGDSRRIMLLLRLAGFPRELAAHLLAVIGDFLGMPADPHVLTLFASYSEERLAAARIRLALDADFKSALKALGHGHGAF